MSARKIKRSLLVHRHTYGFVSGQQISCIEQYLRWNQ